MSISISLRQEIGAFLSGGGVVLARTARLARAIREGFEQALEPGSVVQSPRIHTADKWFEDLWRERAMREAGGGETLLSDAQQLHLWRRVILESEEADRLLQAGPAARLAMEAWSALRAWRIPWTSAALEQTEDAAAFYRWSRRYAQICEQKKWTDGARLMDEVPASGLAVALAGFGGVVSPALRAADWPEMEAFEPAAAPTAVAAEYQTVAEEVRAAAEWAREALRANPGARVGVASTDLRSQRRLFERVFLEVFHPDQLCFETANEERMFAVSGGDSLSRHPLAHSAMLALRLAKGDLTLADAGSLLRSPFLGRALQERAARAVLDVSLRQAHPAYLGADEMRKGAVLKAPVLANLLARFDKARRGLPKSALPSSWASHASKLLRALDWPGSEALSEAENQVIELWHETLSEYASLDAVAGQQTLAEALQSIEDLARSRMVPAREPTPPPGAWILSAREAAGLPFDFFWLCGCTADSWPRPPRPNPFLPLAMQRARGVPGSSAALELDAAKAAMRDLIDLSGEAVFSFASQDGERELRRSPLLDGIEPMRARPPAAWLAWAGRGSFEEILDDRGPAVAKGAKQRGGTRILQLQAACPFRAFAELRLGARAMESSESGLNPRDRGKLLHEVLRLAWSQIQTSARLQQMADQELDEMIRGAIRKSQRAPRDGFEREVFKLEAARLRALVREWLAEEKKRGPFVVVGQEQKRAVDFGGLKFEARMDRVDRLPDGRELILDYKTGPVSASAWEGERPDEPQLPAYAVSHPEAVAGVAFARVARGEMRLEGLRAEPPLAAWRGILMALAGRFAAGEAAVDPKRFPGTCEHCDAAAICRVTDQRRGGE